VPLLFDVEYPNKISADGGRYHFEDDWEFYDTLNTSYEYDGKMITWEGKSCNNLQYFDRGRGSVITGTKGSVLIDRGGFIVYDLDGKIIEEYDDLPYLNEVIGYSHLYHEKSKVGCFYTDALRGVMNVDVTFQNTGGVRSALNEGDITKREIFEISPFNNGTVIYEMSVLDIKNFLVGSRSGFYYSGIQIDQIGSNIQIKDLNDNILSDSTILTIGTNDYIPAVYENYFPINGNVQSLTAAETVISYLENYNSQVNYPNCNRYFRYQ